MGVNGNTEILAAARALIESETNLIANLANIAALLYHRVPEVNWVGFYLWEARSGEWVLGPFMGKPACTRIRPQRGVVGTALAVGQTLAVRDVHEFLGHIACDPDSRSEVVVPIWSEGRVVAGLDVDSPQVGRFPSQDVELLELVAEGLGASWNRCHGY
ncbi:MAG: GAF domain-containing protein [Firmicutes bacterium]|nr:GAF domain-containing protein [Bacillota bacterium]